MEPVLYIAVLMIGYVAGAISAGLIFRSSRGPGLAASEEEFAGLKARLAERDKLLSELRVALEKAHGQEARLQADLKAEAERRAAVESQASRVPALEESLAARQQEIARLRAEAGATQHSGDQHSAWLEDVRKRLDEAVREAAAQAAEAARTASRPAPEDSRREVEEAVKPLQECLARVDERLDVYEKERGETYGALASQLQQLAEAQTRLQTDTASLARALRAPAAPGRWGELQLRRVVELAGLSEHCDFAAAGEPADLIVHLPGRREIVIDAKVPLTSYFDAADAATDDDRRGRLQAHAAALRAHIEALAVTAPEASDFSVAFLPGEPFLAAAVEQDPDLLEHGVRNKVLLATPTSLIALLKAVSFGWRQEHLAQNAEEISRLGRTLYDRLADLTTHFADLREDLQRSVHSYNRAAAALDRQVLVPAGRFRELGVTEAPELEAAPPVEVALAAAES